MWRVTTDYLKKKIIINCLCSLKFRCERCVLVTSYIITKFSTPIMYHVILLLTYKQCMWFLPSSTRKTGMLWLTGPFIKTFLLILKTVLCRKISGGGIYSTFWSLSPLLRKPLRNSFNIYKLRCFIKASTLGPCRLLQACNHQSTSDRISLKNNSFLSFSLPLTVLYCFLFF